MAKKKTHPSPKKVIAVVAIYPQITLITPTLTDAAAAKAPTTLTIIAKWFRLCQGQWALPLRQQRQSNEIVPQLRQLALLHNPQNE